MGFFAYRFLDMSKAGVETWCSPAVGGVPQILQFSDRYVQVGKTGVV